MAADARDYSQRAWWWPALLLAAVVAVYAWSLGGGFIWDDRTYIVDEPLLKAPDALRRIWLGRQLPDFWPVSYTLFWGEWHLFGMATTGYHVVGVGLHLLNIQLLWRVLIAARVRQAAWAALLFAVHPVNVEAVAWIFQAKTTLAAACSLSAALAFLSAPSLRRPRYWVAVGLFALGMLAKAAVVPWSFALGILLWLRERRLPHWRDARLLAPFLAVSLALGLVNVFWYAAQGGPEVASEVIRSDGWLSRIAIGARAFWFYLGKDLVPTGLSFVYPRWPVEDPPGFTALLPLAALAATALVTGVAAWRRPAWRGAAATLAFVLIMLAPVLGVFEVYFMRYSFVADHWQYWALMGVTAAVAEGAGALLRQRPRLATLLGASAAVVLAVLAARHAQAFSDEDTAWRDALSKNPDSWMVHNAHGLDLKRNGQLAEAEAEYRAALALKPQAETYYNLAHLLEEGGQLGAARPFYEEAARMNPYQPRILNNLGGVLARLGERDAAQRTFEAALRLEDSAMTRYNLGYLLESGGDGAGALAEYERATALDPALAPAAAAVTRLTHR